GLVIVGEIALEQLQAANNERVREQGKSFHDHYELATYLLQKARDNGITALEDVGPVWALLQVLRRMGMDSPKELDKYVNRITLDSSRYERPVEGLLNLLLEKHPQA